MSLIRGVDGTPEAYRPRGVLRTVLVVALNVAAIAGLGYTGTVHFTGTPRVLLWLGLGCWLADVVAGLIDRNEHRPATNRIVIGLMMAMVIFGALAAYGTDMLGLVLVMAGSIRVIARPRFGAIGIAMVTLPATLALLAGALAWHQVDQLPNVLLACCVTLLFALIRRTVRRNTQQQRRLAAQELATERERAENAALAERARLAGELHDVLAHSLGALTAQLNAAEALADSGQWDQARARISSSRQLAADGLKEARQAVAALRPRGALAESLTELVRVHRDSGGRVDLEVTGTPVELGADVAQTARRVVQEVLTNARKHAPGQPVDLEISWSVRGVTISASNPIDAQHAYAGGLGQGLTGMRQRCGQVGGWMRTEITPDDEFSVTCFLPVEA